MEHDRTCPVCSRVGTAKRVTTVPGGRDLVVILMVCESCGHQWNSKGDSREPDPARAKPA